MLDPRIDTRLAYSVSLHYRTHLITLDRLVLARQFYLILISILLDQHVEARKLKKTENSIWSVYIVFKNLWKIYSNAF